MSADPPCSVCGHPITLSRCWRLTCPTNGARESFKVAQEHAAARGREIMSGHPSTWGEPPEPEFML
jgi:hypothetical protein